MTHPIKIMRIFDMLNIWSALLFSWIGVYIANTPIDWMFVIFFLVIANICLITLCTQLNTAERQGMIVFTQGITVYMCPYSSYCMAWIITAIIYLMIRYRSFILKRV